MKVLHVINSLATGGAEKLLVDTIEFYNLTDNITADIALLNGEEFPFLKELNNSNYNIIKLSNGSVYNPLLIVKLIGLIKKYDIVHVHLFPTQYWVALASMLCFSNTNLVFTEHSTFNRRLNNKLFHFFDKIIYKRYKKVICITTEVKEVLQNNYNLSDNKVEVVNNGVNFKKIFQASGYRKEDFNFASGDILLCMVAGFRDEKDHKTVIDSLKLLPEHFKLILIGDGKNRTDYEEYVKTKGLDNRVYFFGIRMDVYSILKMCDIAVLSSKFEGFGLAAVESMSIGIPTIGSNVPGLANILKDGGLLFEQGNVQDLVQKINLLQDQKQYTHIANNGKQHAIQYDIHFQVEKIINIYKSIL